MAKKPAHTLFVEKAPQVMHRLIEDFDFSVDQAAGVLGNIGLECGGFEQMHERGQPEGKGGYGWAQWTGPRRRSFFAWCDKKGLKWQTDEANYGYLVHELTNEYRGTVASVLKCRDVESATKAFERSYEAAGVPNYEGRIEWANIARAAYQP